MTVAHSSITASAGHRERAAARRGSAAAPRLFVPALMDLVIARIEAAGGCLPDARERTQLIEEARTIIATLRDTLDLCDLGLAANLHDVYDYMCRRLGRAGPGGCSAALSEVAHLMHEVRAAWFALPHRAAGPA